MVVRRQQGVTSADEQPTRNQPTEYALRQNYPNPFNPSTTINYQVAERTSVVLKIFNITGQEVATLVDETQEPGAYNVTWYPPNLASGVYFYRLQAGSFVETKKLTLLK
jgi:hypothetical protein